MSHYDDPIKVIGGATQINYNKLQIMSAYRLYLAFPVLPSTYYLHIIITLIITYFIKSHKHD